MCCFSGSVEHVSATRIFARPLDDGRQCLVYSMNFATATELAMILPLPVTENAAEDAVEFVALDGYENFFEDIAAAFPVVLRPQSRGGIENLSLGSRRKLVVHNVGDFEASFVPTLTDFDRLDRRFRLAPQVWENLPAYADWGFAVFKLKPAAQRTWLKRLLRRGHNNRQTVHPMAFRFPRRDPRTTFFPTIHVHDGEAHARARFDHALYAQVDDRLAMAYGWERSDVPLGKRVKTGRAKDLIAGDAHCYRYLLEGEHVNQDTELGLPAGMAASALNLRTEHFDLQIHATAAQLDPAAGGRNARWHKSARGHLPAIAAQLSAGLLEVIPKHASEWQLRAYDDTLVAYWVNGERLSPAQRARSGRSLAHPDAGPLRVRFDLFDDRIEPQRVHLAFERLPSMDLVKAIGAELDRVLAGVVV